MGTRGRDRFLTGALALVVTLGGASAVRAQGATPAGGDQQILGQMHRDNEVAIAKAQVARARAVDPKVEAFAVTVIQDRRIADLKLFAFAESKNMSVEDVKDTGAGLPQRAPLATAELEQSATKNFDYTFASEMVADQQASMDVASAARGIARDPDLQGLIDSNMPRLRENLETAQGLAARLPPPAPTIETVPLAAPPPPMSQ
jgi:predicted outer membrane protein